MFLVSNIFFGTLYLKKCKTNCYSYYHYADKMDVEHIGTQSPTKSFVNGSVQKIGIPNGHLWDFWFNQSVGGKG